MREPAPPSGLTVLPVPSGDPAGLWRAAGWLRVAAGHVAGSPLAVTGGLPAPATEGWSGDAAQEAAAEAAVVGARASGLADRLTRAAAVIAQYGDALDAAQRLTVGFQAAYDDIEPTGSAGTAASPPVAPGADPLRAADPAGLAGQVGQVVLAGQYALAMADLSLAGAVAAQRLRGLADEVGEGAVGRGGQPSGTGWAGGVADPRGAAVAGLPLVAAELHRGEADRTAAAVADALVSVSVGDPVALPVAVALLDAWARDPVFAQSLWARLSSDEVAVVLAALAAPSPSSGVPTPMLAGWWDDQGAAVVRGLGTALTIAANPAYAAGDDPVAAARARAWRADWLGRLATEAGEVVRRPDGTTIGGSWVQGQLLAGASGAGLSPGAPYAAIVGVAVVAADIRSGSAHGRPGSAAPSATALLTPDGRTRAVPGLGVDPVLALTEALSTDAAAARAWLVHPLPGATDRMVVDHLVDTRYLDLDPVAGAAAMTAVARLVVVAGSDPGSREATLAAAAYLDAVGRTALESPSPRTFRRALTPALDEVGALLGAHPDALTATLDASAASGTDATALTPAERLVRHGRRPDTWEVVLADRARAAALVGELALDGAAGTVPLDPATGPALTRAMGGIGTTLEADLVAAIAARPTGGQGTDGADGVAAAARRLGATTGFVLSSAGDALARHDADSDAEHRRLADLADLAIGRITVPGATGRLATPLVRAVADHLVAGALPTGAEAAQGSATSAATARRRDDALVAVRTLVSRAHPWAPEQSPEQWAARAATSRSPVPFWDAAGRPLPEPEMTTAQRRSFTDWRHDEGLDVYDAVPQVVRDAVDSGVRDAVATVATATRP